ncbi:peptidase S41 [Silicimonas algicola]|uniref:Peptidase S41-like protein n=1 Tax=Silicimonas algicola TaxID=1826607 RepID=A0A316GAK3_9RHOB|nr:S41 family peptidase [Silicimonas algicola]AZQ67546.1 peptidase S41 [Silicimonas algicola]PWK57245.1 peptidase S41-like protein [Silicimonas algicola]
MDGSRDLAGIREALIRDRAMAGVASELVLEGMGRVEAAVGDCEDMMLEAMRLFALAGNGHTRLIPNAAAKVYPLRLVWSGQGLWSCPEARRVVSVNGVCVEELHDRLGDYLAGTSARRRVIGGLPLVWSPALERLGVAKRGEPVTYRFTKGRNVTVRETDRIRALVHYPVGEQGYPTPGRDPYRPRQGVLRLDSFSSDPVSVASRLQRADEMLERHKGPLVVDLRGNPGGDFIRHLPILDRIEAFGRPVTVLVDRFTFSAAIVFAALCRARLEARVVGEEMGDGLQFHAEGDTLTLPECGAAVRHSDAWHDWETGRATLGTPPVIAKQMRACGRLTPEPRIVTTPDDLAAGKDPALDAAQAA